MEHNQHIHLCILYHFSHATVVELSNYDKECKAHKAVYIYYLALHRKKLLNSVVEENIWGYLCDYGVVVFSFIKEKKIAIK